MTMYSREHRAELLERAYRRGYELRLRRRRRLTTLASIVVIVTMFGAAIAVSDTKSSKLSVGQTTPPKAPTCTASVKIVPQALVPRDVAAWADGSAVVGHGALWTIRSAIDVNGTRLPNGVWLLKFPWFTRPFGLPTISGRRLDGKGTFHANADPATDSRGTWVVSSLEFSHTGCWQVTGRYRTSTLRFRVHVTTDTPTTTTRRPPRRATVSS
jgi:hypothetical protein